MVKLTMIYGTGKGKTTNSLGSIYSQSLLDKEITVVQFLKTGKNCGECVFLKNQKKMKWFYIGKNEFFTDKSNKKEFIKIIKEGIQKLLNYLVNNKVDILLLDELGMVLFFKLVRWKEIQELFKYINEEVIITGRKIPLDVRKNARKLILVDEKKHPYSKGIEARKGVDF